MLTHFELQIKYATVLCLNFCGVKLSQFVSFHSCIVSVWLAKALCMFLICGVHLLCMVTDPQKLQKFNPMKVERARYCTVA